MVQGCISVDPQKVASENTEEQNAIFNLPETMMGSNDDVDIRWSSTSVAAIVSFIESEGIHQNTPQPSLAQLKQRISKFHVHSRPELLKNIGKFCLKMGKFADLAILALKEQLVLVTYQKMFTLAAGQAISDEASVQSGYTLIRDQTMLLLS